MVDCKTITAREIKQIAATFYEKEKYIMWHGKRIKITPLLLFKDVFSFVGSVMSHISRTNGDGLIMEPVDFCFKVEVLSRYANITLPDDIEERYRIIYGSDLYRSVVENINHEQLLSLVAIIRSYTGIEIT